LASTTAASAARFMVSTSWSACLPAPNFFIISAASSRAPGRGMRTLSLPRKPSVLPSWLTATSAPRVRASLRPETASPLLTWAAAGMLMTRAVKMPTMQRPPKRLMTVFNSIACS